MLPKNPNLKSNLPGDYSKFENQLYPKLKNKFGDWFWYNETKKCYSILAFDDESYEVPCDFYPETNKVHMALLNKWINNGWDWITEFLLPSHAE